MLHYCRRRQEEFIEVIGDIFMIEFAEGLTDRNHHYIDGAWVGSSGRNTQLIVNPYSQRAFGQVSLGTAADVECAVQAARRAFDSWSRVPRLERAEWLSKLTAALTERAETIAKLETMEMGTPLSFSRLAHARAPIAMVASYAEILRSGPHDELLGNARVVREPAGVVAAITAWNYPLLLLFGKVAPAIAAGCTVVAKPSEIAPLTSMVLADALHEIGFPKGVINIVNGTGQDVGESLVSHPDVDMVSYTGSTAVGRRIMQNAAPTIKKVSLELGGKSASVILDDAPLEKAVRASVQSCMQNAGQTCAALTRMVVPQSRLAMALEIAADECCRFVPGDPMEESTTLGPLAFAEHARRVRSHIESAIREGARLVCGGSFSRDMPGAASDSLFVPPTVFGSVDPAMKIAQDEVFGPVMAVLAYRDDDEAVAIANGTIYGLNGAVWSSDAKRAVDVSRRLRCGKVEINGGGFNGNAPAGGFKQSGLGRERGSYGLEEFYEVKSLLFGTEELAQRAAPE